MRLLAAGVDVEVGGGAGELVERLAADGAGSVDPQVGGEAGL